MAWAKSDQQDLPVPGSGVSANACICFAMAWWPTLIAGIQWLLDTADRTNSHSVMQTELKAAILLQGLD